DMAENLKFSTNSNFLTSGGYGPNQVSAVLGLGALLCWLLIFTQEKFSKMTWVSCFLFFWFLTQALLTFSRGGVLNFIVAGLFSTPYLIKKRPDIVNKLFIGAAIIAILILLVLPKIDKFTQGAFEARYSDPDTTGRWELIQEDFALWQDNFLLGVGPGLSANLHNKYAAAHTEYSRLVVEHGLFGAVAFLLLLLMGGTAFLRAPSALAKGLTLAYIVWSMTAMGHMAMRLAAISYFFGLSFAEFEDH
ncbi:MAG: O-antigen ligase family protein, partial [Thermoplasmata archaeon]|nr:O-antigen ligase family protein [Thermoplasmata archaeon]